jgi:hypothetical protein
VLSSAPVQLRPERMAVMIIMVNLACIYVAVGGVAFAISAISDRRGPAMGAVFGLVLASFLLSFLAQFWEPAGHVVWLSILDYYQPADVLRSGQWPVADIAVLLLVGGSSWGLGGEIMARRSICTV